MGHKPHKNRTSPTAANSLQDECIRVQKVYDWVTDQLSVRKTIEFTDEQIALIEAAMEDPTRRPLRIVCNVPETPPLFPLSGSDQEGEGFLCEQIGDKRDVNVALPGGGLADAQLVDLLFTADLQVLVVDRNGVVVTEVDCSTSILESFVLCFPDGTDLFCRITKIVCRIPSGTVLLNCPSPTSFDLEVIFCVDIQVEAEVKLEVLAKFCSPRDNDLTAGIDDIIDECPPIEFPAQCPDIFPRPNCDCSLTGEASGRTTGEDEGTATLLANICGDCSLNGSTLKLNFHDTDSSDGGHDFTFTATRFEQDTLHCKECESGLKFVVEGSGVTDSGKLLDFKLAVVGDGHEQAFEMHLINRRGKTVFNTGTVEVHEGELEIEDCINFDDVKFKKQS
ncbi:hypothetical protein GLW07_09455 [Bacillus hwajinpoensis]|uniref:Uncharacterized protein n=1 Tax=Guptibacillus hwajinpoensis TaxID=208199 RepID=A0A845EYJ0_9BACL|nr:MULTISPECIES: hypothetical protein [Bacillaceae]MYL63578.1 hypothetical protein [Pseudalkalibacillus hwajinpoensis]PFG12758.1 hypothetical protein ATG70_0945 [Bacillus sp. es.036]